MEELNPHKSQTIYMAEKIEYIEFWVNSFYNNFGNKMSPDSTYIECEISNVHTNLVCIIKLCFRYTTFKDLQSNFIVFVSNS